MSPGNLKLTPAWTGSGEKLFDSRREACVKPAIAKIHNTEPGDLALEMACRDSIRGSLVEGLMVIFFVIPRTCRYDSDGIS